MELNELKQEAVNLDVAEVREVFVSSLNYPSRHHAKDYRGIWNTTQDKIACIASKNYEITQHKDVVNGVVDALQRLNMNATASLKTQGHRMFVDINFPDAKLYLNEVNETFTSGLRIINSYDKSTGIMVLPELKRLACMNGMVVHQSFMEGISIRHTSKLVADFEGTVEKMLKQMVNGCDKLKAMVNDCIGDSIEWVAVEKIMEGLIGRKKHIEAIKEKLENRTTPTSRWDLYNAITNYATHDEHLTPNINQWLQNKAQKVLTTPLVQLVPTPKTE